MHQADPFLGTLHQWMDVFMQRSMRDFVRYTRQEGFSLSQIGALFQVRRQGVCSVRDLGEHLGVTISAASQLVDRLVQQGLLQRSEDPADRRVKQIALTGRGQDLLQGTMRARQSWLVDLAHTLSGSEKEAVVSALSILIDKAVGLGQPVEPGKEYFRGGESVDA